MEKGIGAEVTCPRLPLFCLASSSSATLGEVLTVTPGSLYCKRGPLAVSPGISYLEIKCSWEGMWPDMESNGGISVGWGDEPVTTFVADGFLLS